ncbi:Arabinose import ATP-binding protein AraG [Bienertia sinuspersici]
MSAIEPGNRDWTKLDLMMAAETDKNNKEVIKKLEEISGNEQKKNHKQCTHEEPPIGLGMSLSSSKKKANQGSGKNNKEEVNQQLQFNTSYVGNSEPLIKCQSDESDAMECLFDNENDAKEIKLKEDEKHNKHFKASDSETDGLCFNSNPLIKQEQSTKMGARKRMKKTGYKERISHKKQKSSSTSIHPFVVCRYQAGRKRKEDGQQRGLE